MKSFYRLTKPSQKTHTKRMRFQGKITFISENIYIQHYTNNNNNKLVVEEDTLDEGVAHTHIILGGRHWWSSSVKIKINILKFLYICIDNLTFEEAKFYM